MQSADCFNNRLRLGKLARLDLGIDELAINCYFEAAPARRDQLQGADFLFEWKEFFRQTDGLWLVVSERAILDCNLKTHNRQLPGGYDAAFRRSSCRPETASISPCQLGKIEGESH